MKRSFFLIVVTAATLNLVGSGVASACLPPAGPPPTAAERAANLLEAQTGAWSNATLVYEAEIVESFMVLGADDAHPGLVMGSYVRTAPISLLKGEGAPGPLIFSYDLGPECTFGPSYSPRARGVGSRFIFYARAAEPKTSDVFFTIPVDAVTDPQITMARHLATLIPAR